MGAEHEWLAATLASDATDGEGTLPADIRALVPEHAVVGRASTATVARDDSSAFREAAQRGPHAGRVLVVGGGRTSRRALMGGIVARELLIAGFEAIVTDGLVRDAADVRSTGLKVWCRGVCPIASQKRGGGQAGGDVLISDVLVREGDWVIADEDGIVIWPQERYDELLSRARDRLDSDREREAALGDAWRVAL